MDRAEADWFGTVGMLVIEWGRLEQRFPTASGPEPTRVDIKAAAAASGISENQLLSVRRIRNATVHRPGDRPSMTAIDEALGVLEMLWRSLDAATASRPAPPEPRELPEARSDGVERPTTYPNPKGDNAWDNDAVHWLLDQRSGAAAFRRGPLMECLRCQPDKVKNQAHRVEEAARLARKNGVIQRQEFDEKLGKRVVRLYRTDAGHPRYPGTPPSDSR